MDLFKQFCDELGVKAEEVDKEISKDVEIQPNFFTRCGRYIHYGEEIKDDTVIGFKSEEVYPRSGLKYIYVLVYKHEIEKINLYTPKVEEYTQANIDDIMAQICAKHPSPELDCTYVVREYNRIFVYEHLTYPDGNRDRAEVLLQKYKRLVLLETGNGNIRKVAEDLGFRYSSISGGILVTYKKKKPKKPGKVSFERISDLARDLSEIIKEPFGDYKKFITYFTTYWDNHVNRRPKRADLANFIIVGIPIAEKIISKRGMKKLGDFKRELSRVPTQQLCKDKDPILRKFARLIKRYRNEEK